MSGTAGDVGRLRFGFYLRLPFPGPMVRWERRTGGYMVESDGSGESYSVVYELRLVVFVFTWSRVRAVHPPVGMPGSYGMRGRG